MSSSSLEKEQIFREFMDSCLTGVCFSLLEGTLRIRSNLLRNFKEVKLTNTFREEEEEEFGRITGLCLCDRS